MLASTRRSIAIAIAAASLTAGLMAATACSGGGGGGPVAGAVDMHCTGMPAQVTSQSVCDLTATGDAGAGDAGAGDGGVISDYGVTMYNSEGDDDDCKYHVKWTSSPIAENRDVTFTVTATTKTDGKPLGSGTGLNADAAPILEVYLSDTHPAPNTDQVPDETSPGTYTIGPIQFDAPGKWTVRFHFYENCSDISDESPHGHAAFYVEVP